MNTFTLYRNRQLSLIVHKFNIIDLFDYLTLYKGELTFRIVVYSTNQYAITFKMNPESKIKELNLCYEIKEYLNNIQQVKHNQQVIV